MRNLKKALSLILALALSLALALPAAGAADVENFKYIKFSNKPSSSTQITDESSKDNENFDYGSFTVCIFPDDTTYTITIPDGGSAIYRWSGLNAYDDGHVEWGPGNGFPLDDLSTGWSEVDLFDIDNGIVRWSIYSSAEYAEEYGGRFRDVAGELLEDIYFCTQSSFDAMIADGLIIAEQTAEPEQPSTPAEPEQPAAPEGISVTVGGNAVAWTDAAPFIDANSRTMVPLRAVADAMSLTVNWDGDARVASFTDGSKTISFPIDGSTAQTSDGGTVEMDTAAVIANERTYAPIRYLAEYFGYTVGWDGATQTVSLTK